MADKEIRDYYLKVAQYRANREFEDTRRFARGLGYGLALALVCWALLGIVAVAVVRTWS